MYLLSNAGQVHEPAADVIPHIERFHGVMFSGDEGVVKPDSRLYGRLGTALWAETRTSAFFIEDRDDNLQRRRRARLAYAPV